MRPIEWLVEQVGSPGLPRIEVVVRGSPRRMDMETELDLYRIVEEGIRDACRHARASRIEVGLDFEVGTLVPSVADRR